MRVFKYAITLLLGFFIVICTSGISQGQDFEGVIYYEVSGMGQQQVNSMPYMIKGNKARIEMNQGNMKAAMLLFPEESKMVILMESMNSYMEMSNEGTNVNSDVPSDASISMTGETKTIAGRECEILRTETAENVVEACMAKGLGPFIMPQNPMSKGNAPAWAQELQSQNAMPLEVVQIQNGNRSLQMRATKIERKSLSDDLFTIPDGYRDMSGMMKKMQQGNQ